MNTRHTRPGLLLAMLFFLGIGCEQSRASEAADTLTPAGLSPDTVLRVHWRGRDDLGIMAGAYYFMRLWELPQSGRVEVQTLSRLATVPWPLSPGQTPSTNQAAALLYPLLADVIWSESYSEIRQAAHQPADFVLAIRLDPSHEPLWQTNLAAVAQSLTGVHPVPAPDGRFGWTLEKQSPPLRMELSRVGQWTLVSAGPDQNALLAEVSARIQRDHAPCVWQRSGDWLEADVDLSRVVGTSRRDVPARESAGGTVAPLDAARTAQRAIPATIDLPRVSLAVDGDGGHVLTRADLTFPGPLPAGLQPWTVPTNLIHAPLMSFTAARGVQPWLASSQTWSNLQIGLPPDQIYSWSLPGGMFQTYFAAPLPNAAAEVTALSAHLLDQANPWLAARGYFGFESGPDSNGVVWGKSPAVQPFVKSVEADGADGVVCGGLIPETGAPAKTNFFYYHPSFPELLQEISGRTNLVYYHWELTGARIQSCLYIGQFLSAISRHPQLPLDSASAVWMKTVVPRLGNCTTTVTLTGPNRLSFSRSSTVGFTAAELNLLAIWLESPQFPKW